MDEMDKMGEDLYERWGNDDKRGQNENGKRLERKMRKRISKENIELQRKPDKDSGKITDIRGLLNRGQRQIILIARKRNAKSSNLGLNA